MFSAKCPNSFSLGILEKGKEITLADIFVEKVRESERAALETKRQTQVEAKELIDNAGRQGERLLALSERDAALRLSASAKADADVADKLYREAEDAARQEAMALAENAASRMDKAVALILERVGGVWQ